MLKIWASLSIVAVSCGDGHVFDASGAFEAVETIISAEAQGRLVFFDVREGQTLQAGQQIGIIDSTQPYLKKKQLEAQIFALVGKKPDIPVQLAALQEQLKTAEREKARISNLVDGGAAPPKQLDDAHAQIEILKRQIEAQSSTLRISSESIHKDASPLQVQVEQLDDLLGKCRITNPVGGTVLTKYAEPGEMATVGKPLYKIADLSNIVLRAYITGNQLPQIRIGQEGTILTDDGKGGYHETEGTIVWISDKAEFTPKTARTKDERANLVYAIKARVPNSEGRYKIGMYGEIRFAEN